MKVFGTDYDTVDGTCVRDYVHVEDLAQAHRLALEKVGVVSGCFNLGTGTGTSVHEIIAAAEQASGRKCPVDMGAPCRRSCPTVCRQPQSPRSFSWVPVYDSIGKNIKSAWQWETNRKY